MIITTKSLTGIDEACNFLDSCEYLTEQESVFYPAMVTIRENSRLGLNLIRLEDLVDYSLANNITDAGYAINSVCEASGIDLSTVGLYVNETTLIEDSEMEDTVRDFRNNNIPTFIAPLPKSDIAYIMAEAVTNCMIEYDNADFLLEAYVDDDIDTLLNEEAFNEELSVTGIAKKNIGRVVDAVKDGASSVYNKISNAVSNAKNASSSWISKKIASLKSLLSEYKNKATTYGGQKVNAVCNKLRSAIDYLKSKLPGKTKK